MTQPKLVSEEAISIYEMREIVKEVEKKTPELGFRTQKVKEYVDDVAQFSDKKAKDALKAIIALDVPRLKKDHVVKILDINPVSTEDLKQLISSFNITVKDEYVKKIFDALKSE
jgi:DNA-directed RNA polymerase subunit F